MFSSHVPLHEIMSDKPRKLGRANDKYIVLPKMFTKYIIDLEYLAWMIWKIWMTRSALLRTKSKLTMREERSRKFIFHFYWIIIFSRGTAIQGGGRKNGNHHGEAHEIMSKIFEQAKSSEGPVKNQKSHNFTGSGKF